MNHSYAIPPFSYMITFNDGIYSENFNMCKITDSMILHYTKDMDFAFCKKNSDFVGVLGLCGDLNRETMSLCEISSSLLEKLCVSRTSFYDAIDMLFGRYIIIYNFENKYFIMNDALSMLKINYDMQSHTVSNNIFLLDNYFRGEKREFCKDYRTDAFKNGTYGDSLPLIDMFVLTPNHELCLNDFSIRRFYPRVKMLETSDVENISRLICNYIQVQERLLKEKYLLLFSLTAGLDSRFTLSTIRSASEYVAFVYCLQDKHVIDMLVAKDIANKINMQLYINIDNKYIKYISGVNNIILGTGDINVGQIKKWCWYTHQPRLLPYYKQLTDILSTDKPCLHIRSNAYEIGQLQYKKNCSDHEQILTLSGKRKILTEEQCKHFTDFFVRTDLTSKGIFGQNLLDYFYWEHRMGTWIPEVLQESDFLFNTHCFFDCRKILELVLSLDVENRRKATVFRSVVNNMKCLSDIPINPVCYDFTCKHQFEQKEYTQLYKIIYNKQGLSEIPVDEHKE